MTKISSQFIVFVNQRFQILYQCIDDNNDVSYYITSNGSDNEYGTVIEPCSDEDAIKLLNV